MRALMVIALVLFVAGCAAPPPPPLVLAFGDNKDWIVMKDMRYRIGRTDQTIVVPAGFVTDFASIPPALALIGLSPHGQYSRAAVVHDYLYWTQQCTKPQADNLLVIAMRESEVGSFNIWEIKTGLDMAGFTGWNSNKDEILKELPRVVPANMRNFPPNTKWPDWRQRLVSAGVKDPIWGPRPAYCAIGNSAELPD